MEPNQSEPVFLHGKKIGVVLSDPRGLTYRTWRDPERHYFIKYAGYGIDLKVLLVLKKKGVERIEVSFDHPKGKIEESKIDWWLNNGIRVQEKGYDMQCILPEKERVHLHYELTNCKLSEWCK